VKAKPTSTPFAARGVQQRGKVVVVFRPPRLWGSLHERTFQLSSSYAQVPRM